MRSLLVLTVTALLTIEIGCATAPKKTAPSIRTLSIQKVGVSPKAFWPEKGEEAVIRWTQTRNARTTVEIHREDGALVRKLEGDYAHGDRTVAWDGKDNTNNPVEQGIYLYSIQSRDLEGKVALYDPSLTTGGEELKAEPFTFDKEKGRFEFVLPRSARVRLRIDLKPFMHLRTFLNWEPMEAGRHTLDWDGLDESDFIRAIDHPDLSVNLAAFALADNAIIVKGNKKSMEGSSVRPPRQGLYLHSAHDGANCRDISLEVEFPNSKKTEEGLPVLEEKTSVRVKLNGTDKTFMVNQRFEVMFFMDTVFLFEEEEGQDPFNYEWDTTGLAPGEHLLTVNLVGYEDHLGVRTVRVVKR